MVSELARNRESLSEGYGIHGCEKEYNMNYRIICDGTDRDQWAAARNIGIGASDVPILFGCGYENSSELRLFAQKRGLDVEPFREDEGMRMGRLLEGAIIEELANRSKVSEWRRNSALIASDGLEFGVCTPDGFALGSKPIEVKNICHRVNEEEWEGGTIPLRYRLQLQTQLAITGEDKGLFGALLFGGRLVWDWIERDEALIHEIRRRVRLFWNRVTNNDPPESNGTNGARNAAFAIAEKRAPVELFTGEIGDYLIGIEQAKNEERIANAAAKAANTKRKSLEDELIVRMGAANEAVTSSGIRIVKTRQDRKGHTVAPSVVLGIKITQGQAA